MLQDSRAARVRERQARRLFLATAIRTPGMIGAVLPSSPRLAAQLASAAPAVGRPVVVELGPGTGAITRRLTQRLPEGSRHLAVDLNSHMVDYLSRSYPDLEVVHGDACHLREILAARNIDRVDAVVSGLPWSLFPAALQHDILAAVRTALRPDGIFTTFAYVHGLPLPSARSFRRRLGEGFGSVVTSRVVWRNLPPAVTYTCSRPQL